jgi:DNA-binding HxlR family transcriptional regulator
MAKQKKKTEVTDLEDLQVKEVSLVDRPANLRTFLIVKRATEEIMPREAFAAGDDTGDYVVEEQDEETVSEEVIKEAAKATAEAAEDEGGDTVDLLELVEDEEDADDAEPDPEGEIQEILKAVTVAQAFKPLNAALQSMMGATNEAKKVGKNKISKETASKFRSVMLALNLISGKGKIETQKAEGEAGKTATAALQKLMKLVNTLKGMKQTDAFPGNLASEAKAIAGSISGLLATSPTAASKKKAEAKVTKAEGTDDNPIVVIKAGKKMKKTRLAKLREAVTLLSSILKELEGDKMAKKQDEPAKKPEDAKTEDTKADKVEKAETETKPEDATALSEIKEGIAKLGEAITGLGEKVETVNKRVADLEGTAPEGNAEEDPPEEVKKKAGLWDNVIPDYKAR